MEPNNNQILPQPPELKQTAVQNKNFKSGIYWRQSLINGTKTIPVILSLESGMLILKSSKGVEFNLTVKDLSVSFSKYGTMTIRINDKSYSFVGSPSNVSAKFSEAQFAELDSQQVQRLQTIQTDKDAARNAAIGSIFSGTLGEIAGPGSLIGEGLDINAVGFSKVAANQTFAAYSIGREALAAWQDVFQQNGVTVETNQLVAIKTIRLYALIMAIVIVLIVTLIVLFNYKVI